MRVSDLITLSDFQPCRTLHLFCTHCTFAWIDNVPKTFRLERFPCAFCNCKGHLTVKLDRMELR